MDTGRRYQRGHVDDTRRRHFGDVKPGHEFKKAPKRPKARALVGETASASARRSGALVAAATAIAIRGWPCGRGGRFHGRSRARAPRSHRISSRGAYRREFGKRAPTSMSVASRRAGMWLALGEERSARHRARARFTATARVNPSLLDLPTDTAASWCLLSPSQRFPPRVTMFLTPRAAFSPVIHDVLAFQELFR